MSRKLRVIKDENGEPAVECPRCGETIQPQYFSVFDGYDCPECGQALEPESLTRWLKAVREYEEGYIG